MSRKGNVIHWFRKGLRLHDNPALTEACSQADTVYPIFLLDPHFANPDNIGINRYCFLLQSLKDLDEQLKGLGSRLYLFKGKPDVVLPKLFRSWNVSLLTMEADYEPYAIQRDEHISSIALKANIEVKKYATHTLHDMDSYRNGAFRTTYGSFQELFLSLPSPESPLDVPTKVSMIFALMFSNTLLYPNRSAVIHQVSTRWQMTQTLSSWIGSHP